MSEQGSNPARASTGTCVRFRAFPGMDYYRIYELDPSDHITAGYHVECGSDAAALRTARALLDRTAGVEVWKSACRVAQLGGEAKHLWPQLRSSWMPFPAATDG